ncbi:DNA-binding transcriptional regulator, MerR family [Thermosyntropha lipolytica DSM 11003]|uniref:DNA-binding transcriptional regulator, MerR family n=1 Tax=Thermosyntropha lipolytica DSM 11003 TaxID=1123382 RepID=A0A1M5QCL2_9FIRM|nr:MerR family transcriptional regulator [Thermosyntropha lipolytica]SHH11650.1 DNA-binding transcriptional regulator, MerR family [Thermosyntropha lipolytica DSM 11003]
MKERYYKIGEVSEMLGIEQYTLRYLENSLQLKIKRNEKGERLYTESDIDTLRLVLKLKEKGLNTTAIKMALENVEESQVTDLVPEEDRSYQLPAEVISLAQKIIEQNDELIRMNKELERRIDELERKIEKRNEEREKRIDEFLRLWRAEQEGRNKSWFSKLVGK